MQAAFALCLLLPSLALAAPKVTVSQNPQHPLALDVMSDVVPTTLDIAYHMTSGEGDLLEMTVALDSADDAAQIMRLKPNTTYHVRIKATENDETDIVFTKNITTSATGIDSFDKDSPFATVHGTPSYEVLVVDHQPYGQVAFDKAGEMVWWSKTGSAKTRDPLTGNVLALAGNSSLSTYGLQETTILAEDVTDIALDGVSHEARVDFSSDGSAPYPVLSINGYTQDDVAGNTIVKWDREAGEIVTLFNLFDYFDPSQDWGSLSSNHDWTHANTVSYNANLDKYIVSIRGLSAVTAFEPEVNGDKVWVLSSEINSDFAFEDDKDKFYNQHCATVLASGNLLLFDNGDARPDSEGGQYSRGVEYALDFDTMSVSKVWEFVVPAYTEGDSAGYSTHAGAITRLDNGNTIVMRSCDSDCSDDWDAIVYEVDSVGELVATIYVPIGASGTGDGDDTYRAEPWDSINGETSTPWSEVLAHTQ